MNKSKVAIIKTSPHTAVKDVEKTLQLLSVDKILNKDAGTILKINISWHFFYPACSTTPWQLEGVINYLKKNNFKNLIPAQNKTVVVNPKTGAKRNHLNSVIEKNNLKFLYLYEKNVKWIKYQPKAKMLVLDKVFPEGILIPKIFIGKNAFHLPTLKTHVFTTITGAMKNAFGGLLRENRHFTHSCIHETLVDLLAIQKEIHPAIFALTDGTYAGNGAGPRAMQPVQKNYFLASDDCVALDAVAAKMMGFNPLALPFLAIAEDKGLGNANLKNIEVIGEDLEKINFKFKVKDTFASKGQHLIYHGLLKPLENILLRSPIAPWSYLASRFYHDLYWYPLYGYKEVKKYLNGSWGELFKKYV